MPATPSESFLGNPVRLDPFQNIIAVAWGGAYVGFVQVYAATTREHAIGPPAFENSVHLFGTAFRLVTDLVLDVGTNTATDTGNEWTGALWTPGPYADLNSVFASNVATGAFDAFPDNVLFEGVDAAVLDLKKHFEEAALHNLDVGGGDVVHELEYEFALSVYNSMIDLPDGATESNPTITYGQLFQSKRGSHFHSPIVPDAPTNPQVIFGGRYEQVRIDSATLDFNAPADNSTFPGFQVSVGYLPQHLFINVDSGVARWGAPPDSTSTAT